jgi:hypothetical protein
LLHLNAEHGSLANQELAKDTRRLAMNAQQDSANVEALTFIATFFIPPTFVSSLFSIPWFDWVSTDNGNHAGTAAPWVKVLLFYLGVTTPLMLVTFSIWGLLVLVRKHRRNKEIQSRLTTPSTSSQGSEVICLLTYKAGIEHVRR